MFGLFRLCLMLAVVLFRTEREGIEIKAEAADAQINPAKSTILTMSIRAPKGTDVGIPDIRDRAKGFSTVDDFINDPIETGDGKIEYTAEWRLVPEPCAKTCKIMPFAVGDIICGPVKFEMPPSREPVTGGMEINPRKDLPPLSWKLFGQIVFALAIAAIVATALFHLVRFIRRKIREHRMSPIERAWVELDRLLGRGLPGRGRYKDFYVELTMVVRRYIQRKYGVKAPNMTTPEFLREIAQARSEIGGREELQKFLESSDMVKFAGIEATPEMADDATDSARKYLREDGEKK